jgi:hypothetical protein
MQNKSEEPTRLIIGNNEIPLGQWSAAGRVLKNFNPTRVEPTRHRLTRRSERGLGDTVVSRAMS